MAVSVCTPLFILTQLLSPAVYCLMYINDEMDFESCLCILCVCVCVSLNALIFIDAGVFYTRMD